jgi:hypothetical protein
MTDTADKQKTPARPAAEVRADIERERGELGASFAELRTELDEAIDESQRRAAEVREKAKVIGPIVAGVVVAAATARVLLRRRSSRHD